MAEKPNYLAEATQMVDIVDHLLSRGKRKEAAEWVASFMRIAFLDGDIAGSKEAYDRMGRIVSPAAQLLEAGHA